MAEPAEPSPSALESTLKAREVEGFLDLYFYRPVGFRLARMGVALNLTPTVVTAIGGVLGILAGHLYFYRDLTTNVIGMFLHVCANAFDNADGQLARLLGQTSRTGRIIDSLFDHFIFLSIYVHLGLRCLFSGAPPVFALVVVGAGLSHALQGAAADYFRNGYLYFARGPSGADWDSARDLAQEYGRLSWRKEPWPKFLIASYLNFTRQQELLSPGLRRLRDSTVHQFGDQVPAALRDRFLQAAKPMLGWWSLLMTNTRMLLLFIVLAVDKPALYFWIELTLFNLLLAVLIFRQQRISSSLLPGRANALQAA
jgi:hypothetical protein